MFTTHAKTHCEGKERQLSFLRQSEVEGSGLRSSTFCSKTEMRQQFCSPNKKKRTATGSSSSAASDIRRSSNKKKRTATGSSSSAGGDIRRTKRNKIRYRLYTLSSYVVSSMTLRIFGLKFGGIRWFFEFLPNASKPV